MSTRETILVNAATILAEEGFASLTLERVAKAVNIKTASLYHHVSSRDELVSEVMISGARAVIDHVSREIERVPVDQPLRRLETAIRAQFMAIAENKPFTVANLRNIDQIPEGVRKKVVKYNRQMDAIWGEIFEAANEFKVFPVDVDLESLRQVVLAAMTSRFSYEIRPDRPDAEQLAEQLIKLIRAAAVWPDRNPSGLVQVTVSDGVGVIELANPPVNSLDQAVIEGLERAIEALTRSDARVVVLRSSSEGEFCGGADLSLLKHLDSAGFESYLLSLRSVFERLSQASFPTIAAIDGPDTGCGLELALACTFRVATPRATFALPEVRMGLSPGAGTIERLPRLVGQQAALDLVLSGRAMSAGEAIDAGLIDRLEAEDLSAAVSYWAQQIADAPRETLAAALRSVRSHSVVRESRDELQEAIRLFASDAAREGLEAKAKAVSGRSKRTSRES